MYTQLINQSQPNQQPNNQQPQKQQPPAEQYRYSRKYPKFSSVRLSLDNISRLKNRASRYNQTIDDIVTIALGQLDYYERLGYETPKESGSF